MPPSFPPSIRLESGRSAAFTTGSSLCVIHWGREADRRRCSCVEAPFASVRRVDVLEAENAAFLAVGVILPDGTANRIPSKVGLLERSVWTMRVDDVDKARRFADIVNAAVAGRPREPLDRLPRRDHEPLVLTAITGLMAGALLLLGGWTVWNGRHPVEHTRTVVKTIVKEKRTQCPATGIGNTWNDTTIQPGQREEASPSTQSGQRSTQPDQSTTGGEGVTFDGR